MTGQGAIEELLDPINAVRRLATEPVGTVAGIPLGAKRLFESAVTSLERERSPYEDTDLKTLLKVAAYKRKIAASYQVDVYSRNEVLQRELDRVAWAHVAGYLTTFSLILVPVPNPVPLLLTTLSSVELLNAALEERGPDELYRQNLTELGEMGVPTGLATRFVSHPAYSPRHQTVITLSLKSLGGTTHRDQLVRAALFAQSEEEALSYQQMAEMLRAYHERTAPLTSLMKVGRLAAGLNDSGVLVFVFPADHVRWTEQVEQLVADVQRRQRGYQPAQRFEVWITGTLSTRARQELHKRGIVPHERILRDIKLFD